MAYALRIISGITVEYIVKLAIMIIEIITISLLFKSIWKYAQKGKKIIIHDKYRNFVKAAIVIFWIDMLFMLMRTVVYIGELKFNKLYAGIGLFVTLAVCIFAIGLGYLTDAILGNTILTNTHIYMMKMYWIMFVIYIPFNIFIQIVYGYKIHSRIVHDFIQ